MKTLKINKLKVVAEVLAMLNRIVIIDKKDLLK